MNNHTEGPWKVLPEEAGADYLRIRGSKLGGRYKIANVLNPIPLDRPGEGAQMWSDQVRANARLIAAAPELLRALESMVLCSKPTKTNAVALNYAHQIIAKARGDV